MSTKTLILFGDGYDYAWWYFNQNSLTGTFCFMQFGTNIIEFSQCLMKYLSHFYDNVISDFDTIPWKVLSLFSLVPGNRINLKQYIWNVQVLFLAAQ